MTRDLMAVVQENNNPAWMEALPGDPLILFLVGVGLGLCGIPLTPYWAFLGFRLGGPLGFLVGWLAALTAMAIQFPLLRRLGKGFLRRWQGPTRPKSELWNRLKRLEANGVGLLWARLAWAIPFILVNTWAAMGKLSYPLFLAISALAISPNIAGVVFTGDVLAGWGKGTGTSRVSILVFGGLGLLGFLGWLIKKWRGKPGKHTMVDPEYSTAPPVLPEK